MGYEKDRKIVTLCHGPAALLAGSIDENKFLFDGYEMTVFPDSLDEGANQEIGYMPGKLKWLLAERLEKLGVKIINTGITGEVCKDRNVLTGDSPLAANNLGILTADELLWLNKRGFNMLNQSEKVIKILGTKYPLIQAPMNWLTNAELVAAVSNSGGLGILGPNAGQREAYSPEVTYQKFREEIQNKIHYR